MFWKLIHDFLSNFYWHFLSRTDSEVFDFKLFWVWPWPLNAIWGEKNHIIQKPIHDFLSDFHWHFLSISYSFWDIWLQTIQGVTLTFGGHLRLNFVIPFKSPYMTSYLTSIDTFYLVLFLRYLTSNCTRFDRDFWPLKVISSSSSSFILKTSLFPC